MGRHQLVKVARHLPAGRLALYEFIRNNCKGSPGRKPKDKQLPTTTYKFLGQRHRGPIGFNFMSSFGVSFARSQQRLLLLKGLAHDGRQVGPRQRQRVGQSGQLGAQ